MLSGCHETNRLQLHGRHRVHGVDLLPIPIIDRSLVHRSCFELPRSIVAIHFRSSVSEHFSLPDEDTSPRKDEQSNRADRVKHIRNAHCLDPSRHSKDEDRAKQVPQECERGERVADNFCKQVSINHLSKCVTMPLNSPL